MEDLYKTLSDLNIIDPKKVAVSDVYTLKFLNK